MRALFWILAMVAFALVAMAPAGLRAADADVISARIDAGNRLNLADRQLMLTQRMTTAACLSMRGIDTERQAAVAVQAATEFEQVLVALQDGARDRGLRAEQDQELRRAYAAVAAFSAAFTASAKQIAHGDLHTLVVEALVSRNLTTLMRMDAVVAQIEAHYGTGAIDPQRAMAITVAGRQRMVSQKIVKELCFLSIGLGGAAVRQSLADTVRVFDTAVQAMFRGGDAGSLGGLPSPAVRKQLRRVKTTWKPMKAMLDTVVEGAEITQAILLDAHNQGDKLLVESNNLVLLYTQD